jgi:hypothetical protein
MKVNDNLQHIAAKSKLSFHYIYDEINHTSMSVRFFFSTQCLAVRTKLGAIIDPEH